ncbi:MAG: hypothetical protein HP492_06640 [Nitrospira sp.]|nr:hypothetical protein [Nitrospira sp.]MBH0206859.1 hypothetical protein [Nitrospira sp.]
MITPKVQFGRHTLEAMTVVFVFGALSMIWPSIIAISFGIFLLLQSFLGAEQAIAILSWAEVSHLPIALSSFRRFGSPAMLS